MNNNIMEGIGTKLKKIRLEKGLSLQDVHKKTKIHLNILKAIEEESLVNLNPIYIKGFIKIYCKFLGVDSRDFIPDYKEQIPIVAKYIKEESQSIEKLRPFKPKINIKAVLFIVSIVVLAVGLFYLGKIIVMRFSQGILFHKKIVAVGPKVEERDTVTSKPIAAPSTDTIRLMIRAKEDSWLRIKTDGRVVFQGILKKGRFDTWRAKDKIELSAGNAGAVILEVNGKIISNLGRKNQPLKSVLITKEGLTVRK